MNNVETLSNVPHIVARGAEWFRACGTAQSPGTVVATVVGDVQAPGVAEVELGTTLRAVINQVGGGLDRAARSRRSRKRSDARPNRRVRSWATLRRLRRRCSG